RCCMERRDFLKQVGRGGFAAVVAPDPARVATRDDEAAPKRIKVGQIGVGHAHAAKLAVYRAAPDYEVLRLVQPDPELRNRAETRGAYGDLPWMTREQLLEVPGLQAVLVETRVRDLLNAAEACVTAGKHILLDKPAGESLPQFKRILDAAAERKL